jgi:phosphoserine phosphatase
MALSIATISPVSFKRNHILVLTRHGETDWNSEKRFQGQRDIPLNGNGRNQAEKVARDLRHYSFDAIFTSDLSRASDTAKCIAKYHPGTEIQTHSQLREISHGDFWEGRTEENLYQSDPLNMWRWKNQPTKAIKPGGEPLSQAYDRVAKAVNEIRSQTIENSVTHCPVISVVAHEGTNRLVLCYALGLPLEQHFHTFMLPNCAIAVLEFSAGKAHARFHGSTLNAGLFAAVA